MNIQCVKTSLYTPINWGKTHPKLTIAAAVALPIISLLGLYLIQKKQPPKPLPFSTFCFDTGITDDFKNFFSICGLDPSSVDKLPLSWEPERFHCNETVTIYHKPEHYNNRGAESYFYFPLALFAQNISHPQDMFTCLGLGSGKEPKFYITRYLLKKAKELDPEIDNYLIIFRDEEYQCTGENKSGHFFCVKRNDDGSCVFLEGDMSKVGYHQNSEITDPRKLERAKTVLKWAIKQELAQTYWKKKTTPPLPRPPATPE